MDRLERCDGAAGASQQGVVYAEQDQGGHHARAGDPEMLSQAGRGTRGWSPARFMTAGRAVAGKRR
jgi:hypothetical protein